MKAKHWTQTAAGKKRMSMIMKHRHATNAKGVAKVNVKERPDESQEALHTAFILGKVDSTIEQYCASIGLPKALVTHRVAQLLLGATSREVLGAEHSMSGV